MEDINRKAAVAIARMFIMLGAIIFLPAWTVHYWQGWSCLVAFCGPTLAVTIYLARRNPALLERRMKAGVAAERETAQKIIQFIAFIVFLADFAVSAFDHRFGWSSVPVWATISGDLLIVAGFVMVFMVFKANSFTSGIIEVAPEQKVISTGPYAIVRHPMYAGALLMLFGIPLALASWWGELANVAMTAVLAWRLLNEEKFLAANLSGYQEYRKTVKYRLVPLVW